MSTFTTIVVHNPFRIRVWMSNPSWFRVSMFPLGWPFVYIMPSESFSILRLSSYLLDPLIQVLEVEVLTKVLNLLKLPAHLSLTRPSLYSRLFCSKSMLESFREPSIILCSSSFFLQDVVRAPYWFIDWGQLFIPLIKTYHFGFQFFIF